MKEKAKCFILTFPTTNSGCMQNGSSVENIHILYWLHVFCTFGADLYDHIIKISGQRSVGSLLREQCWLGSPSLLFALKQKGLREVPQNVRDALTNGEKKEEY